MRALVIGGTGPTGPFIVSGLIERGYEVTVLNRGLHDNGVLPANVAHIIADPHFPETLAQALEGENFDVVVATYGRMRYVASVVAPHTERLITIGGSPGLRGSRQPERLFPSGQQTPLPEDAPLVESAEEFRFGYLARISEDKVFEHHAAGDYVATHLRYPIIYGPRQLRPTEWMVMRRILDKRPYIVLPDSGLTLITRGYGENMANAVLLAVDQPDRAGGEIFNCGDCHQLTLAQWVEIIADEMDAELEIVSVPGPLAYPARDLMINRRTSHHQLFDLSKIQTRLGYQDKVEVMEALQKTVRFYLEQPVVLDPQAESVLMQHYRTEDQMAAIQRDAHERLQTVEYVDPDYVHPYAHPKSPGSKRDHHGR